MEVKEAKTHFFQISIANWIFPIYAITAGTNPLLLLLQLLIAILGSYLCLKTDASSPENKSPLVLIPVIFGFALNMIIIFAILLSQQL